MSLKVLDRIAALDPGRELFRTNLIFCLFAKARPAFWAEPAEWLVGVMRDYIEDSPAHGLVGASANSFAPMTAAKWGRVVREIGALGVKEDVFFNIRGPEVTAADFELQLCTDELAVNPDYPGASYVQILAPVPGSDDELAKWETLFREAALRFVHDTGYAGIAILPVDEAAQHEAGAQIGPIALRHPGLDVALNDWTNGGIGYRSRGARWLTFLSHDRAAELDAAMLAAPPDPVTVERTAAGLVIRASPDIQLGDVNRNRMPEGLPWVAELLHPITRFGDQYLTEMFRGDFDLVQRWEERFFEDA